jgi:PAS domain S-box-containing protein
MSLLSETVLRRYSRAMQRTFREDYRSVAACQGMMEAADAIDSQFDRWCWQGIEPDRAALAMARDRFEQRLSDQEHAATLVGEQDVTAQLRREWEGYRTLYSTLLDGSRPSDERRAMYGNQMLEQSVKVHHAAERLIHMNLASMLSVHSSTHGMAARSQWAMHALTVCGIALALAFALMFARLILQPVRALTDSARQIERGNLDLTVPVTSRDELGALASAFNQMTTQLRAYRQREHDRLVRTEQTTQLAIDSLPDAVAVVNPAGRIELVNETAKRFFGLVPGADVRESAAPWLEELYRRIVRTEHAASLSGYESIIEAAADGEQRAFLPRTVPILDDRQNVIGATVVLADVTGLRRLDEMKSGLLSMVSHELKTPLTSMRMVLHLITEQRIGQLSDRQRELLLAAREDAERLHQIVENLLDMARIESGKALMELQPIRPFDLARQGAGPLRGSFEGQQVSLELNVPADLPVVRADPTRVGHVIANLLNNALRYTPAGGHVIVHARLAGGFVEFSVSDDGAGIPRSYLPRIFEKFFRAPGQQGGSGSGLGLAIAKDIVEAHGGRIRVESSEGRGTVFAFTLRRADEPSSKNGASANGSREFRDGVGPDARSDIEVDHPLIAVAGSSTDGDIPRGTEGVGR